MLNRLIAQAYLKVSLLLLELALWSRGWEDGSQSEGPRFDPHVRKKRFTIYVLAVFGIQKFLIQIQPSIWRIEIKIWLEYPRLPILSNSLMLIAFAWLELQNIFVARKKIQWSMG